MKLLVVVSLISVALGWTDDKMLQNWQTMKAMEQCWGEENMKLYTVHTKKAIAKCSHEDAPELNLAPFRSTYRFVNAMLSGSDQMENQQFDFIEKMMRLMLQQGKHSRPSYRPYSRNNEGVNNFEKMKKKFFMKQMMERMMKGNMQDTMSGMPYSMDSQDQSFDMMDSFKNMFGDKMESRMDNMRNNPENMMNQFFDMFSNTRSKRAANQNGVANPNLDLGDRLVEKLNEQKKEMEAKIGNMTCVLKEMECLNADNNLDIRAMKEYTSQFTMPSQWFEERHNQILDTCYEMATNLPANIENNAVVTGDSFGTINLAEIKSFVKCCSKAKLKLCMNQDIKNKVEANFGPLEEILEQTQLTEYELFPLVIQLLHGEEMEYMMAEF